MKRSTTLLALVLTTSGCEGIKDWWEGNCEPGDPVIYVGTDGTPGPYRQDCVFNQDFAVVDEWGYVEQFAADWQLADFCSWEDAGEHDIDRYPSNYLPNDGFCMARCLEWGNALGFPGWDCLDDDGEPLVEARWALTTPDNDNYPHTGVLYWGRTAPPASDPEYIEDACWTPLPCNTQDYPWGGWDNPIHHYPHGAPEPGQDGGSEATYCTPDPAHPDNDNDLDDDGDNEFFLFPSIRVMMTHEFGDELNSPGNNAEEIFTGDPCGFEVILGAETHASCEDYCEDYVQLYLSAWAETGLTKDDVLHNCASMVSSDNLPGGCAPPLIVEPYTSLTTFWPDPAAPEPSWALGTLLDPLVCGSTSCCEQLGAAECANVRGGGVARPVAATTVALTGELTVHTPAPLVDRSLSGEVRYSAGQGVPNETTPMYLESLMVHVPGPLSALDPTTRSEVVLTDLTVTLSAPTVLARRGQWVQAADGLALEVKGTRRGAAVRDPTFTAAVTTGRITGELDPNGRLRIDTQSTLLGTPFSLSLAPR